MSDHSEFVCKGCGASFTPKKKVREAVYCSRQCCTKNRLRIHPKPITYYKFTCRGCGEEFVSTRKNADYCSRKCFFENYKAKPNSRKRGVHSVPPKSRPWDGGTRPDFTGANHPMFGKKHKPETIEKVRAKTLEMWKSGAFEQWTKRRRESPLRGPEHFNYKNGSSDLRSKIYTMHQYRSWIKNVFKKDNYTCVRCGVRGGPLEAHHHVPVRELLKAHDIHSVDDAIACSQLWEVSNGMTLCTSCHGEVDSYRARFLKKEQRDGL